MLANCSPRGKKKKKKKKKRKKSNLPAAKCTHYPNTIRPRTDLSSIVESTDKAKYTISDKVLATIQVTDPQHSGLLLAVSIPAERYFRFLYILVYYNQ
jgi:hypothetical protein